MGTERILDVSLLSELLPDVFSSEEGQIREDDSVPAGRKIDSFTSINQATVAQCEDKPTKVQPVVGWKSKPKAARFDFEEAHKDYEESRLKGQRYEQQILKKLEGNERACDYVKLYFQSASVLWDIEKFREHLMYDVEVWEDLRSKYGNSGITNYTRRIATAQTILQALES